MKTFILAAASAAALVAAVPAFAADLPMEAAPAVVAVPSFSWTGAYLGFQGSYAWGRSNPERFNVDGWLLGAYAGYNFQLDNSPFVVGVETDFNYSDQDDRVGVTVVGIPARIKNEVNWAGATRARVGVALDRLLFYAAGGVAYAQREATVQVPLLNLKDKDKKTAVGWTVGGGLEAATSEHVVLRVEYRYTDYGNDRFTLLGQRAKSDLDEHRIAGGIAYKF